MEAYLTVGTFSKHPSRYPALVPGFIHWGEGCRVYAGDSSGVGSTYVDWVQGLGGTGIFSHRPEWLLRAVEAQEAKGTAFHLSTLIEQEVSGLLASMLPWAESTRTACNGTDVTAAAVRLARAVTGRDNVIAFHGAYHGESTGDWSNADKMPARGIPSWARGPIRCTWNDSIGLTLTAGTENPAAIIFEVANDAPTPEFIAAMHAARDATGCLLIADEVVTGFRLGKQGACGLYGIQPDLACYGKALGSGFPIAALVGKREYMREFDLSYTNEPVFMSFTHAGNTVGLAAAKATLEEIERCDPFPKIWDTGRKLMRQFDWIAGDNDISEVCRAVGQAPRSHFKFAQSGNLKPEAMRAIFIQQMAKHGVLMGIPNFPTTAHDAEALQQTFDGMEVALKEVAAAVMDDSIEGHLVGDVPVPLYVRVDRTANSWET